MDPIFNSIVFEGTAMDQQNRNRNIGLIHRLRNKIRIAKGNSMQVGSGVHMVGCRIRLKGCGNRLVLGDNVRLRELFIEISGEDCLIEIGKNTHIGHDTYIIAGEKNNKLKIGESCALASGIKIRATDGHDVLSEGRRINLAKDIVIGDRVWFGDNVTVLKGVTVGNDSVLGIDAVVTKSVPPNSIAAGNPAQVVKQHITWREELTF
jgi:acetyltransferase-like isoleucine patch superfamily enzyme